MAFLKRTWLARLGTGLNKFLIGDKGADGKQTLTNSPDTVVQEGDVISAENLNDLEDRIEDEFENVSSVIQTNLNYVNNMKLKKIWENPNPTASFSSQSFILEPYNGTCEYVIEFRYENPVQGSNAYSTEFKHFKFYNPTRGTTGTEFSNFRHVFQNASFYLKSRRIELHLQDNNIYVRIEDCYQVAVDPNSTITMTTENDQLIPVAIYKVGDIYNS